jgi:prevent-host-death family protein
MRKVGTCEAKTHFSALVDAAERGEAIVITRNGKPVAQLGPLADRAGANARAALGRILARRLQIGIPVRELLEEGRNW